MKGVSLSRVLGWVSLGLGLTELAFPKRLCHVLGVGSRYSGLVRGLGVRELASGCGLLLQPQRQEWVWSRVAGDAMDLTLLAVTFGLPRANRVWQGFITAAVAGVTLVDVYAALKPEALGLHAGTVTAPLGMGAEAGGPTESWRGSGLAEDIGAEVRPNDEGGLSEEERRRMMREAERQLGLPRVE